MSLWTANILCFRRLPLNLQENLICKRSFISKWLQNMSRTNMGTRRSIGFEHDMTVTSQHWLFEEYPSLHSNDQKEEPDTVRTRRKYRHALYTNSSRTTGVINGVRAYHATYLPVNMVCDWCRPSALNVVCDWSISSWSCGESTSVQQWTSK